MDVVECIRRRDVTERDRTLHVATGQPELRLADLVDRRALGNRTNGDRRLTRRLRRTRLTNEYRESTEFVIADIPGIIEGASEGRGLGHQFLRHIERARVLCLLIDLAPMDGMDPHEQEKVLLHELGQYRPDLLERPRLVLGT
ncbi:MAG: hypothetical protein EBZ55_06120, partial [Actinobacteria bacterium]|nr:hypothetical protein [Actinomycetota bacterium]